jgi:hypothetical protein
VNFIVNRQPHELWGKARKEPEWRVEEGPSGQPTGRIRNARGQVMKMEAGKWKTVKP